MSCRPSGILQHARDVVVAQAVGRLDADRRFHARAQRVPTPTAGRRHRPGR
jgi:hypothetical protein